MPSQVEVETSFNYITLDSNSSDKPFQYTYSAEEGKPTTNVTNAPFTRVVHDIRGNEGDITLDTAGFQLFKHTSQEKEFLDEEHIKNVYYPETEELLKKFTGAHRVFIFDHTIRRRIPGKENDPTSPQRQPVLRVHIDQTTPAAYNRVTRHLPEEAEELVKGRFLLINVWRPIKGPVVDFPLGMLDFRTVKEEDLVPTDLIYPDRVGEIYYVTANPEHRWYYVSNMETDEVVLLKCFDSKPDGRARLTPHSAFKDPRTPVDSPPRESIEVRALVFLKD